MDVKTNINIAKSYISDIFEPEGAFNIGLEEVIYDSEKDVWSVTVGFSRPWDRQNLSSIIPQREKRTYKIVDINNHGQIVGMRNRATDFDLPIT